MAIYLTKISIEKAACIRFEEFEAEKLEKGKHLFDNSSDFSTTDRRTYEKDGKLIQFGDGERIQVDQELIEKEIVRQLIDILEVSHFHDDRTELTSYPISEITK